MKFTIECDMEDRWIPHFLSMLKYMELLGKEKKSRIVCINSYGYADFRPVFNWDKSLPDNVLPSSESSKGDRMYDAG